MIVEYRSMTKISFDQLPKSRDAAHFGIAIFLRCQAELWFRRVLGA